MNFKKTFLYLSALFWLSIAYWLWRQAPAVHGWPLTKAFALFWFAISFFSPAAFYYSLIPALALFGNNPGGPHHLYLLEFPVMGLVVRHLLDRATGRVAYRRSRLDVWVTLFVLWSWLCLAPQWRFLWVELTHTRWGFMFAIFSHYVNSPTYGLECALKLTLAAGMYAQLRDRPWRPQQIAAWLKWSVAVVAMTAILGLGNWFGLVPLEKWRGQNVDIMRFDFPRLQSVYWHSGWYAQYVIAFVPAAMAMAWFAAGRRRAAGWSLVGLLAIVTLLTMQRAGWLGFAAGCTVAIAGATWMNSKDARAWAKIATRLAAGLGGLMALALVLAISSEFFRHRMQQLFTFEHRTLLWRAAVGMIKSSPLTGIGIGNYFQAHNKLFTPENVLYWIEPNFKSTAHNLYLHVAAERGLIGLVLLLGIMGVAARLLIAKMAEIRRTALFSATDRVIVIAIAGGLAALAIDGLFQYEFYVRTIELIFWLMIGWATALEEPPERAPRGWVLPALILAAVTTYGVDNNFLFLKPWTISIAGDNFMVGGREVRLKLPNADRVSIKLASMDPHNQTDPVKYTLRVGFWTVAEDTFTTQTARTYTFDVPKTKKGSKLVITASHDWSPFEWGLRSIPFRRVGVLYLPPAAAQKK